MWFGTLLTALQPISGFLSLFTRDLLLMGFQNSIQRTWRILPTVGQNNLEAPSTLQIKHQLCPKKGDGVLGRGKQTLVCSNVGFSNGIGGYLGRSVLSLLNKVNQTVQSSVLSPLDFFQKAQAQHFAQ